MPERKALNRLISGKRLLFVRTEENTSCPIYIRLEEMAFKAFFLYFCGTAAKCPGLPTRRHWR